MGKLTPEQQRRLMRIMVILDGLVVFLIVAFLVYKR